ncbi:unnamed protein product [Allacma fusca]|uniref:Uncharacterized protein n=1 Tax=Allacma fusca TaxID=39272 RepID=A0A8J2L475_9HEXA|nr:unnamed protein product [Allacma fusca]
MRPQLGDYDWVQVVLVWKLFAEVEWKCRRRVWSNLWGILEVAIIWWLARIQKQGLRSFINIESSHYFYLITLVLCMCEESQFPEPLLGLHYWSLIFGWEKVSLIGIVNVKRIIYLLSGPLFSSTLAKRR